MIGKKGIVIVRTIDGQKKFGTPLRSHRVIMWHNTMKQAVSFILGY